MTVFSAEQLRNQVCQAGAARLQDREIDDALAGLPGWTRTGNALCKTFGFADFHATIEFVNAVAWIANKQDHHPDLDVHYNRCGVAFSTHDAGGITLNDLICAARVEAL